MTVIARTELLGRVLTTREHHIPRGGLLKATREVRYPRAALYAGLFAIRNFSEERLSPFLLAEAPRLLFPFARRVIADVIRDGGFPPLLVDPIDFGALYLAKTQSTDQNSGIIGHG